MADYHAATTGMEHRRSSSLTSTLSALSADDYYGAVAAPPAARAEHLSTSSSTSATYDDLYHDHYDHDHHHHHHHHPQRYSPSPYSHDYLDSGTTATVPSSEAAARTVRKRVSLAQIAVPSFSAFRSQLPSAVKRLPSAFHSSPRAVSFSLAEKASQRLAEPSSRPLSLNYCLPKQVSRLSRNQLLVATEEVESPTDDRESYPGHYLAHSRAESIDSRLSRRSLASAPSRRTSSIPVHSKYANERTLSHAPRQSVSSTGASTEFSPTESEGVDPMVPVQEAPTMTLQQLDGIQRSLTDDSLGAASVGSQSKRPKSPGGLGSFFGWKSPAKSDLDISPTTTFSERSLSPIPSPGLNKSMQRDGAISPARLTPSALDVRKGSIDAGYFENPETPLLLSNESTNAHVRELERELSHVSQELAGSIKREMELEDELDRLRAEFPIPAASSDGNRRGSDYFSDIDASSTRFPITDVDAKIEQLEKQVRKVEQDKANLQVEAAARTQTELSRRRDLEELVQHLEDQVHQRSTEFETTLDETKKRLGREKQTNDSFEDLYNATKEALEKYRNEADNLRDEVVPQLRSRIEGLEAEAANSHASMYENTRMQQEYSRQRSGSGGTGLPDAMKQIEDQRDALHKALQLIIQRHTKQQKDHQRAIKRMTASRDLAEQLTPRKGAYHREVSFLKEEVATLRKRTEDALEQKWQYEKGLSGIKMDLDRAEQETRELRACLQEHNLGVPSRRPSQEDSSSPISDDASVLSLYSAEGERDAVRKMAAEYRDRAKASGGAGAADLTKSAQRLDELANKLDEQVKVNQKLRDRLAKAVAKGEREQKESTGAIEEMQKRLISMEDSVLSAQQHSETTLANHDSEARRIEDANSPQLQRLTIDIPEPSKLSPTSPMFRKSPKMLSSKLSESSLLEMGRTQMLERKVKELEGLLREADDDMQTVVQRVNRSQLEVAELQTERDAAMSDMRKLQNLIAEEKGKAARF